MATFTAADVRACLAHSWGLPATTVRRLRGGMNSYTWQVRVGDARFVAKVVPEQAGTGFVRGLAAAAAVDAAGIPTGRPRRTADGRNCVAHAGHLVALLAWVDGRPLRGDRRADQVIAGRTLGTVHQVLAVRQVPETGDLLGGLDPDAVWLGVRPGVRVAFRNVLDALAPSIMGKLTCGVIHADPSPDEFRHDPRTGQCGLIDWGAASTGPFAYDVASTVMFLGGPDQAAAFLASYGAASPLDPAELDHALHPMLRLRWAMQAYYFSSRMYAADLTGVAGPADNERGLGDAMRWLRRLSG